MKLSNLLNPAVSSMTMIGLDAIDPLTEKCIGETASTVVLLCGIAYFLISIISLPFLHKTDLKAVIMDNKHAGAFLFIAIVGLVIGCLTKTQIRFWIIFTVVCLLAVISTKFKSRK